MSVFEAIVVSGGGLLILLVLWKMFRFGGAASPQVTGIILISPLATAIKQTQAQCSQWVESRH